MSILCTLEGIVKILGFSKRVSTETGSRQIP